MRFMHKSHSRFGSRSLRRPSSGSQSCATVTRSLFALEHLPRIAAHFIPRALLIAFCCACSRLSVLRSPRFLARSISVCRHHAPPLNDVLVLSLAGGQPFAQVLLGGCLSFAPFPELRLARIVV